MREIDLVVVKGKTQPVAIHEVMDYHNEETYPQLPDALGHFRDGLERYRNRAFGPAAKLFAQVLAINPDDKVAGIYVERCDLLSRQPPAADWAGVWVMESK
jgi:adenylate cyclase